MKNLTEELNRSKRLMGLKENQELAMGKEIEKEHQPMYDKLKNYYDSYGDFPNEELVFMWIAKDHLAEFNDYYTRLEKMENDAEQNKISTETSKEPNINGISKPRPINRDDLNEENPK